VLWALGIVLVAFASLFGLAYGWYRYEFPYGWSHCCLQCLKVALETYAEEHDGRYPAGGGCPEASLSLLYGTFGTNGWLLCGKTKSPEVADKILKQGQPLGPDTCDWHYVEGLTLADDPQLAIVWDKVGLGHNGERLDGGHSVLRLNGQEEIITASEWPKFLEEQRQLLATRTEAARNGLPALTAKIRLPSGKIVDHYDGCRVLCDGREEYFGRRLSGSSLRWYRLGVEGTHTYALSLNGWKSKPVEVKISHGKATPDSIIFEM
jgi:hypothetical protein